MCVSVPFASSVLESIPQVTTRCFGSVTCVVHVLKVRCSECVTAGVCMLSNNLS